MDDSDKIEDRLSLSDRLLLINKCPVHKCPYPLYLSLSGEMVEKILVVKANMDKLLLGPPTEIDSDETDDFDDYLDDI